MGFIYSGEKDYLEQREPTSTLENPHSRNYSFQKRTLSSLGNIVLGAAASNIDGFLSRGTWVSSTQMNIPMGSKQILTPT
jgi:hypothetical protein